MFPNFLCGPEGEQFNSYADERVPLGTALVCQDGRLYRFGKVGAGAAAVVGNLYQSPVPGANYDELALPAAVAVGSRTVVVTNGATAITEDQFKGGFLNVEDDAGEGRAYLIESNTADAGAGPVTVTLAAGHGIKVALTTVTTVGLTASPYSGLIIHPSPPTACLIGVAASAIAAGEYGWFQRKGPASVLGTGTLVIGKNCVASVTVPGSVDPPALTEGVPNAGFDQPMVGRVMEVAATTEYSLVFLDLE